LGVPRISVSSDQTWQTPVEAVTPVAKYLLKKNYKNVWEPACGGGKIAKALQSYGLNVVCTDIKDGFDFFRYEPVFDYDVIVTNPPFNRRIEFLKRCYSIGKPFCLLMPTIFTIDMGILFRHYGIEMLVITRRLRFIKDGKKSTSAPFSVAWFCRYVIDEKLVFF
jgi:hypothetical protein